MNTADLIILGIATLGTIAFLAIYMGGARWYINPVGRFLVVQALLIVALCAKGVIRLGTGMAANVDMGSLIANSVVAAVCVAQPLVVWRVMKQARLRDSRNQDGEDNR